MRDTDSIAKIIYELFTEDFGGKSKGRFKISRSGLTSIAGRTILKQSVIESISDVLLEQYGIYLVDLGDEFSFLQESTLRSYREVTKKLILKYKNKKYDSLVISQDFPNVAP